MSETLYLATNYLLMTEASRQMWSDLDRHLEKLGGRLVLLSSAAADPPLPFPVIPIPFLLRDYANAYPSAWGMGGSLAPHEINWLAADASRAQGAYGPEHALAGLLACRRTLATLLEILRPGYVLTWDSTSPQAAILRDLSVQAGIPVQSIERGLLPETLMIESRGIQGHSDLRTHWLAQDIPVSAFDSAAFQRIREYYLRVKPQKYNQPAFSGGGAELRKKLGLGEKKVVVFFGHYDPCGLTPPEGAERRLHSPAFSSTQDLLMCLWNSLEREPDLELIFKPHPIDGDPYTIAQVEGVKILKDVNVHALIDLADVVVAQFTTLQFEAALYDKPVVLAGRSAWWGRGACYEVERRETVGEVLRAALNREAWAERRKYTEAFLVWIMDQFLIACTPQVPARRTLGDFAAFLARTSATQPDLAPKEERWERAQAALRELARPLNTSHSKSHPYS